MKRTTPSQRHCLSTPIPLLPPPVGLRFPLLFVIVLLPSVAVAAGAEQEQTSEVAPIRLGRPAPQSGVEAVQEEHVVQPGDTLWGLSQRYLSNPWYWPKVWSYNPQLSNPHFLYPGDKIRFYRGEGSAENATPAAAETNMPDAAQVAEGPQRSEPGSSRPAGKTRGLMVQNVQLLSPKELKEAGVLTNAAEPKEMLSTYDVVFVRYGAAEERPAVGKTVVFFKKVADVPQPRGGDYAMTLITGTGVVTNDGDARRVAVRIDRTWEPVERGQLVAVPAQPLQFELHATPNEAKVRGTLVGGEYHSRILLGQFNYVFVDRGSDDGVKNGNTFVVLSDRDKWADNDDPIPEQVVGQLIVVEAKAQASLALVARSVRELAPGDRVEMRQSTQN